MSEVQKPIGTTRTVRGIAFLALLAFAAILGAIIYFAYRSGERSTDDAYVTGHLHPISCRVSGTVEAVMVDDNQFVHAGDELARIDTRDFEVRVALEQARVEQAISNQESARAAIDQANATIASAAADSRKAQLDFARAGELIRETPRGLSQQEYDASEAAQASARAKLQQAYAQLEAAKANLVAAQAVERQSRANVRDASLQLSYTHILSPVDGYVGRKTIETGARISAGETLLSVVEPRVWVVANFRETQLSRVQVGDPVEISVDALPALKLHGHVDSVSPATGAQFALLPPDNATGNFTKVVQRVPVKILLDNFDHGRARLAPGLSVTATLDAKPAHESD
ncbi:membrane fusion protein (multidrug efflux system) [Paraburkholderia bannensis]|uniref:Membrane fusion protein (Multidrug efflux system) n=1 Tax=Paraburkholderia bannensis TaxID=765414 RepID=A0A7W9U0J3_9BURK|nr:MULTISPECIES: HlyD family secretion protein [Paraburkholderia]MBB3259868.1 membrane fusion protein (multidrug efflux system) [Paraburkholderia sp. WP4_3_2]MBB6104822.1 membrane fusion protein (multidrug efflux system) [Paraburkholderia bannensis]